MAQWDKKTWVVGCIGPVEQELSEMVIYGILEKI